MAGVLAKRLVTFMKAQDVTKAAAAPPTPLSMEKEAKKG